MSVKFDRWVHKPSDNCSPDWFAARDNAPDGYRLPTTKEWLDKVSSGEELPEGCYWTSDLVSYHGMRTVMACRILVESHGFDQTDCNSLDCPYNQAWYIMR